MYNKTFVICITYTTGMHYKDLVTTKEKWEQVIWQCKTIVIHNLLVVLAQLR